MNWVKEAANDLKTHSERKVGIANMRDQIKILEEQYISIKGNSNSTPVMGGGSKQEDTWINNIVKRERLKLTLEATEKISALIDKGLESLSDNDRYILELFFINRTYDYKDKLCEKFHVEEAQIYRMKDTALRNFTYSMYGIAEY